jgi:hypothetical protein
LIRVTSILVAADTVSAATSVSEAQQMAVPNPHLASVQWGDITLDMVQTKSYQITPVTDPTGMDVVAAKHSLTVMGRLTSRLRPSRSGETSSETLARLKSSAMRHRRYFRYSPFGQAILEVGDKNNPTDPAKNLDIVGGPKCTKFEPVELAEAGIAVVASFDVVVVPCESKNFRSILSHRWSERETYDELGYCTRSLRGHIMLRADKPEKIDDILFDAHLPPIREGYQVNGDTTYELAADGLSLTWSRSETEYEVGPAEDALSVEEQLDIDRANGGVTDATIAIVLKAPAHKKALNKNQPVSRYDKLVQLATRIYSSRHQEFMGDDPKREKQIITKHIHFSTRSRELLSVTLVVKIQVPPDAFIIDKQKNKDDFIGINPKLFAKETRPLRRDVGIGLAPGLANNRVNNWGNGNAEPVRPPMQEPCGPLAVIPLPPNSGTPVNPPNQPPGNGVPNLEGGNLGGDTNGTGGGLPPNPYQYPEDIGTGLPQLFMRTNPGGGADAVASGETQLVLATIQQALQYGLVPAGSYDPFFPSSGGGVLTSETAVDPIAAEDARYTNYLVWWEHDEDTGMRSQPTNNHITRMSRPFQAHTGTVKLICRWTAERYGLPPVIPDWEPPKQDLDSLPKTVKVPGDDIEYKLPQHESNYILTRKQFRTEEKRLGANNSVINFIAGAYHYDVIDPDRAIMLHGYQPEAINAIRTVAENGGGMVPQNYKLSRDVIWWGLQAGPGQHVFRVATPPATPPSAGAGTGGVQPLEG